MHPSAKIFEYIKELPEWEMDALRRLVLNGKLDHEDDVRTLALIKIEHGGNNENPAIAAEPISSEMFSQLLQRHDQIFIEKLIVGQHCNALPQDACLSASPTLGLSLYWGANGSGKSSFVRLFRAAGRARVQSELLPNMSVLTSGKGVAKATFILKEAEKNIAIEWSSTDPINPKLSAISAYDNECNRVYLMEGSVAEYMPRGMEIFSTLVDLRKRLKSALQVERDAADEKLPELCDELHRSQHYYGLLWSAIDSEANRRKLSSMTWTIDDENELVRLNNRQQQIEVKRKSHAAAIEELAEQRAEISALQNAAFNLVRAKSALNDHSIVCLASDHEQINRLRHQLEEAVTAHAQSVTEFDQESSCMTGLGSPEWLALVRAAMVFSKTHAYPDLQFPATTSNCVCVLCHQHYSPAAKNWMSRLMAAVEEMSHQITMGSSFINQLKQKLLAVESRFNENLLDLRKGFSGVRQSLSVFKNLSLAETVAVKVDWCNQFISEVARLADELLFDNISMNEISLGLEDLCQIALSRATALQRDFDDTKTMLREPEHFNAEPLIELNAKRWLCSNAAIVHDWLCLRKNIDVADRALSTLGTTILTGISKKIASDMSIDRLVEAINCQLERVGLSQMRAQVVTSARAGVTTIRLAPIGNKKIDMLKVLSIGEQSLMGFAVFMAELQCAEDSGPVIIDDASFGLDARNCAILADLILDLSKTRQLLYFTHDRAFAEMLQSKAPSRCVACEAQVISRQNDQVKFSRIDFADLA